MIDYEEDWFSTLMFRFEGSVAPRAVVFAMPSAVLGVLLVLVDDWSPSFREDIGLLDLKFSQIWTATTGVIILMLGFRVRQALSRFWEGTSLLHQMRGEWFDTVSNCVTFSILAKEKKPEQVWDFRHTIVRLMSLAHGSALEEIAGAQVEFDTIDVFGLHPRMLKHVKECNETYKFNKVEVLLHSVQSLIIQASADGVLTVPPPILSRVFQTISRGFVNLLNAKKITDTRFPFPFAQLISFLLVALGVLTPLMLSTLIFNKFLIALFTFVPMFGMCCMNYIAIELENPFGLDPNDLPLGHFQTEMNSCLLLLLHPNTDIIASVGRGCIKDFEVLFSQITHPHPKGDEAGGTSSCRISNWNLEASVLAELEPPAKREASKENAPSKAETPKVPEPILEAPITMPAQEPEKKQPPKHESRPQQPSSPSSPVPSAEAMEKPVVHSGSEPSVNGKEGVSLEAKHAPVLRAAGCGLPAEGAQMPGIPAVDTSILRCNVREIDYGKDTRGPELGKALPMRPPNPDRPAQISPGDAASISRENWYNTEMMVARGMHEFNLSMQRWTKLIETQVSELDRNCQALRSFNDTVSFMEERMQAKVREV